MLIDGVAATPRGMAAQSQATEAVVRAEAAAKQDDFNRAMWGLGSAFTALVSGVYEIASFFALRSGIPEVVAVGVAWELSSDGWGLVSTAIDCSLAMSSEGGWDIGLTLGSPNCMVGVTSVLVDNLGVPGGTFHGLSRAAMVTNHILGGIGKAQTVGDWAQLIGNAGSTWGG